jgi:hypothetical protein
VTEREGGGGGGEEKGKGFQNSKHKKTQR